MAKRHTFIGNFLLTLIFIALTACGGGSTSSEEQNQQTEDTESVPTTPPPQPDPDTDTDTDTGTDTDTDTDPDPEPEPDPEIDPDSSPEPFLFEGVEDVSPNTEVYSNIITVNGINQPVDVLIQNGEYSVEGRDFVSTPGAILNGETLQVRHIASERNNETVTSTLSVGDFSTTFSSVTEAYSGQLAIAASGTELLLLGIGKQGEISVRGRASIPQLESYNPQHNIFSITKHPSKNQVFVTSQNHCDELTELNPRFICGGNARVDRFSFSENSLDYDGLAFLAQPPLRLSKPSITKDNDVTTVAFTITNQSESPINISELIFNHATHPTTVVEACEGAILTVGDACTIALSAGTDGNNSPRADIDIITSAGNFHTYVLDNYYSYGGFRVGYYLPSLSSPDDLSLPDCALDGYHDTPPDHGPVFTEDSITLPPVNMLDFGGKDDKAGSCRFENLVFNESGSRIYAIDPGNNKLSVFSVDEAGKMHFLSETDGHLRVGPGLAINQAGTTLYSGMSVFTIADDQIFEQTPSASGTNFGKDTELVTGPNMESLLLTTSDTREGAELAIYELDTDPAQPIKVSSVTQPEISFFYTQHHSDNLAVFAAGGGLFADDEVETPETAFFKVYQRNDGQFAETASSDLGISIGNCDGCEAPYIYGTWVQRLRMNKLGTRLIAGGIVGPRDTFTRENAPWLGALVTYAIDEESGELSQQDLLPLAGNVRDILLLDLPVTETP